jgi:RNA polymerase sigma-70 factor, ECF subfamily
MKEVAEHIAAPLEPNQRSSQLEHGARPTAHDDVERLFSACERRLGRFLAQMVGNRALAEDLLQESFYEALRCHDQLQEAENPEAWLFGIARNRALAALRRGRRLRSALERLVQRTGPSERDDLELLALRDLLERHLNPEDRALLILRYLHGFDAIELAAMSGRTPEAVRQRLARARRCLVDAAGREFDSSDKETKK